MVPGGDQCASDPDGTVDLDERLNLIGITAGIYDVKLIEAKGELAADA
jgi:hypothetical protein